MIQPKAPKTNANRLLRMPRCAISVALTLVTACAGVTLQAQSLVRIETGANQAEALYGATGDGVVVAVLDRGIDVTHPDFRNADGSSRILWLLDHTGQNWCNAANTPAIEYSKAQIDAFLNGGPAVGGRDVVGHGDATAGLAASNGRSLSGSPYRGIAPEADLIVVKMTSEGAPAHGAQSAEAAFNGCIEESLDWLDAKLDEIGKPAVAIINSGTQWGPMDGTGAVSRKIDAVFGEHQPGRIMVLPAGDEGSLPSHSAVDYEIGVDSTVTFHRSSGTFAHIIVWADGEPANVTVELGGATVGPVGPGQSATASNITVVGYTPGNEFYPWTSTSGDYATWIGISGHAGLSGTVRIQAQGTPRAAGSGGDNSRAVSGGTAHVYSDLQGPNLTPVNQLTSNLAPGRLSDYGSTRSAIIVGNHIVRTHWTDINGVPRSVTDEGAVDELWLKSPYGPTRDGRAHGIDITAPGQGSWATLSPTSHWSTFDSVLPQEGNRHLIRFGGTSGSAPIVTGTVALMLQFNPNLTTAQARRILRETAREDAYTGKVPNTPWGWGKLDVLAAVEAARDFVFGDSFESGSESNWNP